MRIHSKNVSYSFHAGLFLFFFCGAMPAEAFPELGEVKSAPMPQEPQEPQELQEPQLGGAAVQGGLLYGKASPETQVFLNGLPLKMGHKGDFVLGFAYDAAPDQTVEGRTKEGALLWQKNIRLKKRDYKIERVDGLPPKTVTPPPEWLERRKLENAAIAKARAPLREAYDWQAGFIKPAEGRFSGFYGSQRILNGTPRTPHFGLDIAAKTGEAVLAPTAGIVTLARPDFLLEGGIIIIDHGFGLFSTLFHLSAVEVKEGAYVAQGARIGAIGQTGRANGPHVDWRLNWQGVKLDPGLLVGLAPS